MKRTGMAAARGAVAAVAVKSACILLAACAGPGGAARAQSISAVAARQRYPWNDLVDIDYTITGAANAAGQADGTGLYIRFEIIAGGRTNIAASFDPPFPPVTDGAHRVTWDPGADGIRLKSAGAVCRAALYRDDTERYLVIDLSGGTNAAAYRVGYLPGVSGWTTAYKTGKLVMRKIDPVTFNMGSPADEVGHAAFSGREDFHPVTLTSGFYIGVFEVTQRQWELVTGRCPALHRGDCRPIEMVSYNRIRGGTNGSLWPESPDVDPDSFIGRLRARTKLDRIDLPTDAQWECACRAGTTNAFSNGKDLAEDADAPAPQVDGIGRYKHNWGDGRGGCAEKHTVVGSYAPNPWGLYDMHGNVCEWCLDWYEGKLGTNAVTDPSGPDSGNRRVMRGGSFDSRARGLRSAYRGYLRPATDNDDYVGFRLCETVPSGAPAESLEFCGEAFSGRFAMEVGEDIRVAQPHRDVSITFSDRWDGPGGAAAAAVEADGAELTNNAAGEGLCVWAPARRGVTVLRHMCGTNTLEARIFLPPEHLAERFSDADSGAFPMDVEDGARAVLPGPVGGITYSGRWGGGPGGAVTVGADGAGDPLYSGAGAAEGVCEWTPETEGTNLLRHTCGEDTLEALFLVMKEARSGRGYSFQLAEADPVAGPPPAGKALYKGPYTWGDAEGLPGGLALSTNGVLSGRAACRPGSYRFTARITDSRGESFTKSYPLLVRPGGFWMILH